MRETQRTDHTALRTVELAELDALEVLFGGGGAVECWRAGRRGDGAERREGAGRGGSERTWGGRAVEHCQKFWLESLRPL